MLIVHLQSTLETIRTNANVGCAIFQVRTLGGSGSILDISKHVWQNHEADITAYGDLLYTWQYEIRWAGDLLRRDGVIRPAEMSPRGVWELA